MGVGQVESRVWERMGEKGIEVEGQAKERNGGCDLSAQAQTFNGNGQLVFLKKLSQLFTEPQGGQALA